MAKPTRKALELLGKHAVREATAGNVWPLIGRVGMVPDSYLAKDERSFLCIMLEANDGRRGKAEIRRIEKLLVSSRVEGLVAGEGGEPSMKKEAAVKQVGSERERGRSRSSVFATLRESRKRK